MAFKTHIVNIASMDYYSGLVDEIITYCGISSDGMSESMVDQNPFAERANSEEATCKRCVAAFKKELKSI